jgi:Na+/melibiose symporter-like transporter
MADVQPKRLRYGEYGLLLVIVVIGLSGVLYFGEIVNYDIEFYLSLLLAVLGIYTVIFVFYYGKFIHKSERNYMFLWGYILAAIGFALFFDLFNHNLFLNVSIAVVIGALLGFVSIKYAGK